MAQTTIRSEQLTPSVACSVYLGTQMNDLTADQLTLINLDTETYDIGSNFNTSTHLFTAPVAGIYTVSAGVRFSATGDGNRSRIAIYANSTIVAQQAWAPGVNTSLSYTNVSVDVQLSANDTISLYATTGTPSTGDILAGFGETWMTVRLVGI